MDGLVAAGHLLQCGAYAVADEWLCRNARPVSLFDHRGHAMESVVVQIALYTVATWVWVRLVSVARRDLPAAIYVQQNLGLSTPRSFYQLARRWRWLVAGGLVAVAVAGRVPEARAGVAVTALAVAIGLLTYIHQKMARFLDPRVVSHVVRATRREDGPDEPQPVA